MLLKDTGEVISVRDYDATGSMISKAPDERTDRDPFGFTGGLVAGRGLKTSLVFEGVECEFFIAKLRHVTGEFESLSNNKEVYCGLTRIPIERALSKTPFDLSWWRGGVGLIASVRKA